MPLLEMFHLVHSEGCVPAHTRVSHDNRIHLFPQIKGNAPPAVFHDTHQLRGPLVGTSPGAPPGFEIHRNSGDRLPAKNRCHGGVEKFRAKICLHLKWKQDQKN